MENRQTEIKTGEGLLESRLNQDFIDWLRKWGFWILLVLAIASLSYAGMKELDRRRVMALDDAFREYRDAQLSGSPDSLLAVASQHQGKGAVPVLATLEAADIYLKSARSGVAPGGIAGLDDDLLDENARTQMANRAGELYEQVYARTKNDDAQLTLAIGARWGIAAVKVIGKDFDGAQSILKEISQEAKAGGFDKLAEVAEIRLARLDELELAAPLPRQADLPTPPPAPAQGAGQGEIPYLLEQPAPEPGSSEFSPFIDPKLEDIKQPTQGEEPPAETGGETTEQPPETQPAPAQEGEGGGGA